MQLTAPETVRKRDTTRGRLTDSSIQEALVRGTGVCGADHPSCWPMVAGYFSESVLRAPRRKPEQPAAETMESVQARESVDTSSSAESKH